ncbi:2-dehydropantoate 2-reductase [Leptospira gomenensis]|uniref:2-dehydropantoate 2-reductase n=1 Tax=Leptospira gomenensis TaxID=2484974 RepID=A0A5F1Y9Y9_9LEPT|nr:2-dehydropantoate 2-reductase [Leptospira gomenensis]TGK33385.1 2-dehydropantoate 2-reductase [Leptospira gomenensis]TGK39337.1 2-dehydropantoate 2-reductase [Leptospira gomenensis]TGK40509.1 2-dehydropantoate 2-reductase [Leptospira gomenensis]TGK67441.1 2-dehydropantoate 2-reductase [Leptospira gomenensis]
MNPSFAILGAGSIGTYLGCKLIAAGNRTILYGREKIRNELKTFGARITDFENRETVLPPDSIPFSTSLEETIKADVFLVTVKSKDTKELSRDLSGLLEKRQKLHSVSNSLPVVISFQNGVRNADILREELSELPVEVLAGMVPFNVVSEGKGRFHRGTSGNLVIQNSKSARSIVSGFNRAGLFANTHKNIQGVLWGKLIFNLNNSLNALSGLPLKEEISRAGYRKLLSKLMTEALEILRLAEINPVRSGKMIPSLAPLILNLPDFLFFRIASGMVKIDPQARSSMWEDLTKKRPTEIDSLNGEVVKLADVMGHPAPLNRGIIKLIKQAENDPTILNLSPEKLAKLLKSDLN